MLHMEKEIGEARSRMSRRHRRHHTTEGKRKMTSRDLPGVRCTIARLIKWALAAQQLAFSTVERARGPLLEIEIRVIMLAQDDIRLDYFSGRHGDAGVHYTPVRYCVRRASMHCISGSLGSLLEALCGTAVNAPAAFLVHSARSEYLQR